MLTLTRKAGEKIHVGEDVVLQVVRIEGNKVILGFAADRKIKIMRSEVLERDNGCNNAA